METWNVATLGARGHYLESRLLHSAGKLEAMATDICCAKGWPRLLRRIPRRLQPGGLRKLVARVPLGIPPERIVHFPFLGLSYAWKRSRCRSFAGILDTVLWGGRKFCERVNQRGFGRAGGLLTYNTAGLESLILARSLGLKTASVQTIAPMRVERRLLAMEASRWPGWEEATPASAGPLADFIAREEAEWAEAGIILCGSEFVLDGIRECGGPVEKVKVVPLGLDPALVEPAAPKPRRKGPLRVLTVGVVGLRKGSPYVLQMAKRLKHLAEFRMVGPLDAKPFALDELRRHLDLRGPVPRSEVQQHFDWADAFLLPSVCEGSATVCYEALAKGLPVVATPNAGSVVRDGREGFIVPAGDLEALTDALEDLARHEDMLREFSKNALDRAAEYSPQAKAAEFLQALGSEDGQREVAL